MAHTPPHASTRGPAAPLAIMLTAAALTAPRAIADGSLTIVLNHPGTFIDISATGTALEAFGEEDEQPIESSVGNTYYPAGTVWIGNNGGIAFQPISSTDLGPIPSPLPSPNAFGGDCRILLPYWSDIGNHEHNVLWQEIGEAPNRVLIIQWNAKTFHDDPEGPTITLQCQVFESPGPLGPFAQFLYSDIEAGLAQGGTNALIGTMYIDENAPDTLFAYTWAQACPLAVRNGSVLSVVDRLSTPQCLADFNTDGFVTGEDFDDFTEAFEVGGCRADFNNDSFVNGDDFDLFTSAFEEGC